MVKPVFKHSATKAIGKVRRNNKIMYAQKVDVKNASYEEVKEHIEKLKNKLKKDRPNAEMNIALGYESMSKPISSGFFNVQGEVDLAAPYDFSGEDDVISYFYIQYAI